MVSDVVIIASCSFGSALFGLFVGLLSVKSGRSGTAIYPETHVSFEPSMKDADRLRFLDRAAQAIRDGELSQPDQLQNYCPSNQAAQPGANLEK